MKTTRREFITTVGAGGAVAAVSVVGAGVAPAHAAAAKLVRGHVVQLTDDRLTSKDRPVADIAQQLLARGMMEYTGKKQAADAWATLFSAKDLVGVKINCLGKPCSSTTPEVVSAIIAGLVSAGVKEERIIVFDLFGSHMAQSRYRLRNGKTGVRYLSVKRFANIETGFEDEWRKHPSGKVQFAKLLLQVDKVVSVPLIKDHALSGVTCALKNMAFGTVVNPSAHHQGGCDPGIANIYNMPQIKDKVSLIVCDGAFMQYDGGPQCKPAARVALNSLYVTSDPVALDKLAWEQIDTLRKAKNLRTLDKDKRRVPKHIATAAGLGLGVDDRTKIKVVKARI